MTRWRYAAATDTGLVRLSNQDALYVDRELAIIADGMGGHAAGEVAAAMSIEIVREGFGDNPTVEGIVESIQRANTAVVEDARENPEHFGMGTTIIAVGLTYDLRDVVSPTLVHVGDSRAYQLRDGAMRQLSEDHSVAEEWVRMGRLTADEAAVHPRRHQLTRGVGVEDTIAIDVTSLNAAPGDRILLCSDGLSNELDEDTLARLASSPNGLETAVENLVSAAKQAGGHDNISAILLEFDEVTVTSSPIRRTMSTAPPAAGAIPAGGSVRRRRLFNWRIALSGLILIGVVLGSVAIVHWYAYSTYYIGSADGYLAVYQGQPGGVLWYPPIEVEEYKSVPLSSLRPSLALQVRSTISEPTMKAIKSEINYLANGGQVTTTTTTTSTTGHGVTTTTVATG